MLILSTFNSDYLQKPLQSLKEHLPIKSFKIEYVEANLKQALFNLQTSEQKPSFCVILLRLSDLVTNDLINIAKKLVELNNSESMSIIVFWCPSINDNSLESKGLFDKFEKILENKVYLITAEKICNEYSITSIQNTSGEKYHIPYTIVFYCGIAALILKVVYILTPKPWKLIAFDFDNTAVSGISGEDSHSNITIQLQNRAIQQFLIGQQKQGKLIVLCSKNYEEAVYNVFNQNKEMLLTKDHFIKKKNIAIDSKAKVFKKNYGGIEDCYNKINYEFKFENIKNISDELNISLDQILFIDDNEDELSQVEKKLPEVGCVKAPQNMEEFHKNLIFNSNPYAKITDTDKKRTELYSNQVIMPSTSLKSYGVEEYSEDIKIFESNTEVIHLTPDHKEEIERLAELTQRCNQFNLYQLFKNKAEIKESVNDLRNVFFIIREKKNALSDLSEVALGGALCSLEKDYLIITGFVISCRAFTRKMGIENILIKHIANLAVKNNLETIKIKFKKTEKNIFASDFLKILINNGFSKSKINSINLEDHDEREIDFFSNGLKDLNVIEMTLSAYKHKLDKSIEHTEINKRTIGKRNKYYQSIAIVQEYTESLDKLISEFFFDIECLKSIESIETKVTLLCNKMLTKKAHDRSLVERGLDSIGATELRGYLISTNCINENYREQFEITYLLNSQTTAFSLAIYLEELKKTPEKFVLKESIYEQGSVSFQQERLWLAEQLEPANNSANFHMLACYKVSKQINIKHFELACKKMIQLYDAFGTSFSLKDGKLKQFVSQAEERELNFQVEELGERTLEEAIQDKISKPWTMQSKAPLIRVVIFEDNNYHIFIHAHHAIFDATSLKNCLDSLSKLYVEYSLMSTLQFYDPPQYQKFINYQHRKLADEADQFKAYWKSALSKIETVTTLPSDQSLSFKPATEQIINRYVFSLSAEDLLSLKDLAKANGVTCFSAVNALFGLLIANYTFKKSITLITATNGRGGHSSFDKMIGFFVNLLIQQFDLDESMPFVEYLKQVNKKFLDSLKFQDIPFIKIQEILQDKEIKDILTSPALIYQNYIIPELRLNAEIAELELPRDPIIFDMRKTCRFGNFTLFAQENTQGLSFLIEYAKDLFSLSFIEAFGKNFLHTIKNICSSPNQKLQDISVVCNEEREQLINLGQGPKLNFSEEMSLVSKFQQNVDKYPENIALCCGEIRLNYKELDRQSTNLAHALTKAGVQPGNYVGIFLDTNHTFFIAELTILKIGAVFIPLSKESPNERLKLIISDANIRFFIVDDDTRGLFDINFSPYELILINAADEFADLNKELPNFVKTTDKSCVLYTSGSTGVPKGVVLPEKGILRVVELPNFVQVSPGDKIAQTANQAFDAAQLECWLAWNHGATLVLFDKETILNIGAFRNKLKSENITHMWLTAGLFDFHANNQPDLFENLRYLMVGGDVVHKDTVLKVLSFEKHPIIVNGYGPTEASIFASTHTFDIQTINNHNTTLIGSPINETGLEIRTLFGTITPIGGIGELCIKGNGIGSYLNSPKLNQEKFTEDGGKRTYQTGDLVKYTTKNPEIMFMGRANKQQVKINGYLVSPEEVRNRLSEHSAIKQVEILIIKKDGINQLVAFYILNLQEKLIKSANQAFYDHLSKSLPAYMFPANYIQVDSFPTNANGKLDEFKFQKYELKLHANNLDEILPKTKNGKKILKIVQNVLIGFPNNIEHNFIFFGCTSLKVMQIINAINNKFKPEFIKRFKPEFEKDFEDEFKEKFENYLNEKILHANDLYQNPTIQGLENLLINKLNNNAEKKLFRELKKGDPSLPAIIFIHPAGGGISLYKKLTDNVEFNNFCYGIEDPLLEGKPLEESLLSMRQMAQNYLSIITKEIQGFFILAGYSFGGMLALEIAAQYEAISENDYLLKVILFDTWIVSCASDGIKRKLKEDVLIHCAEQRREANFGEHSSEMINLLEKLCIHHQEIGFEYKLKKLIFIAVHLFKATILDETFAEMNLQAVNSETKDNFLSLDKLSIQEIKATHFDILKSSSIGEFFAALINENNIKKCANKFGKKVDKGNSSTFFGPLNEIHNDPKFICSEPKVK
jgi:amino acid adenylation domain-containing protein/FkbH-like protein